MAELDAEELWGIDVKGYLHLPGAVSDAELRVCAHLAAGAADPSGEALEAALAGNDALRRCLTVVSGVEVRQPPWQPADGPPPPEMPALDVPWHVLRPEDASGGPLLRRKAGRNYHNQARPGQLFSQGLVVIVALQPQCSICRSHWFM